MVIILELNWSDLSGATVRWFISFFRIQNIELNCSFVRCRKYHKSWWNGAAELPILVDLLCGSKAAELHNSVDLVCGTTATTAAELQNSVDLLCGTAAAELQTSVDLLCGKTVAELQNSVNLLCDSTAAELNNPVWCRRQESHTFSKDSDEPCLIQSKILLSVFYLPTAVDLQQSFEFWRMNAFALEYSRSMQSFEGWMLSLWKIVDLEDR